MKVCWWCGGARAEHQDQKTPEPTDGTHDDQDRQDPSLHSSRNPRMAALATDDAASSFAAAASRAGVLLPNILITGTPGCGKTTTSMEVAEATVSISRDIDGVSSLSLKAETAQQ